MKTLIKIQSELKAPKNQFNSFGKYKYRSCEDILEALKPHLSANNALLTISDKIVSIGDKLFVQATATYIHDGFTHSVTASAMHPLAKKGMDDSQITGSASSYARKYALNGLFCIDDNADVDSKINSKKETPLTELTVDKIPKAIEFIKSGKTMQDLKNHYSFSNSIEMQIIEGCN